MNRISVNYSLKWQLSNTNYYYSLNQQTTQMTKEDFTQLPITIILVGLMAIGYKMTDRPNPIVLTKVIYSDRDSLCKENVKYWLKVARIKHDSIVFKQAIIESGNLKCTKCSLDSNNLFGFSNGKRYLTFNHWIESIFYYAWWQKRYKGGDYYLFLNQNWKAEDKTYINKLK